MGKKKRYNFHRNSKDLLFKYLSKLFKEDFFHVLGIEAGAVDELLPSDLPRVQTQDVEVDFLCRMKDGTLLHLEFQTTASESDIDRFMKYDSMIYDEWKKSIQTYAIYGRGISKAIDEKNYGSIHYKVHNIFLMYLDGDQIVVDLWKKVESGQELTEEDMGKLVLLPFMKSKKSRADITLDSAFIAGKINDQEKQSQVLAFILAMSANFLNENEMDQILGVMKMTRLYERLEAELIEKGYKKGMEMGMEKAILETATHMLKEGASIEFVMKVTKLSEEQVKSLLEDL